MVNAKKDRDFEVGVHIKINLTSILHDSTIYQQTQRVGTWSVHV